MDLEPGDDYPPPRPVRCPLCGGRLGLTQPDPERAERLLGTCGRCDAWFLLDGRLLVVKRLDLA